jgi:glycosyltransferase involved in cell wall biosynthesis
MANPTKHLVIDLIPLLPGGANGGAKLVVLSLLKGLQKHLATESDSHWRITLLTAPWNEGELIPYTGSAITYKTLHHLTQGRLSPIHRLKSLLKKIPYKISQFPIFPALLDQLQADLLFCPFSNPSLARISIPCVSILHDLQHWHYPNFFSPQERHHRDQYLRRMIQYSQVIVCVSHFTEQSLQEYCRHFNLVPKATTVIYHYFPESLPSNPSDPDFNYSNFTDPDHPYLLYPANYWPHKNHRTLLHAYARYLQNHHRETPHLPYFNLVLTGTLETEEQSIKALAQHLNIQDQVHFLGYLDSLAFKKVWLHCAGLIFPSLYEGFGLPIVEAMAYNKPILCSQIPCLEEVTGGACLYFNPTQAQSIAEALRTFTGNIEGRETLTCQSQTRFQDFQNLNPLQDYLAIFDQLSMATKRR